MIKKYKFIKCVCIKNACINGVYPDDTTLIHLIKDSIYFVCELLNSKNYAIYDGKMNFLICIFCDEYKEHFLEFSEYRNKQINDILDD